MARDHNSADLPITIDTFEYASIRHEHCCASCRSMIRDHLAASLGIEIDDFDLPPFNQQGGLGRVDQLFGAELPKVIEDLNRELVA